jgi:hypothetical protein
LLAEKSLLVIDMAPTIPQFKEALKWSFGITFYGQYYGQNLPLYP